MSCAKPLPPPSFVACHLALVVVVVVVVVAVVGGRRVGTMRRCTDAPMRRCTAAVRLARPSACPWTAAVLQGPPASRASAQSGNGAMAQWSIAAATSAVCGGSMCACAATRARARWPGSLGGPSMASMASMASTATPWTLLARRGSRRPSSGLPNMALAIPPSAHAGIHFASTPACLPACPPALLPTA